MADIGPLPSEVQKKRIRLEIARLEHQMLRQDLEKDEKTFEIQKIDENIEASRREIEIQKDKLVALDKPQPTPIQEEING